MRIALVGPSFHFLSGLSVYTCRLANALAEEHEVSTVLLRRLIPERLYPGGHRAGADLTSLRYADGITAGPQIDWHWGLGLPRAVAFLRRERPEVLVLQWWTAATLHTFLALAAAARRLGIPVVIEFHELQDTGETGVPLVGQYRARLAPVLLSLAAGAVVHNEHDLAMLRAEYGSRLDRLQVAVVPHGPYDHLPAPATPAPAPEVGAAAEVTQLLFFGLIRPYKGLEDLIDAFDALTPQEAAGYRLTVVGETWEGWTLPAEKIAASPHRERITFVNRYVSDEEAAAHLATADAVVLPYRRGSASGPLQIAMSQGKHVVLYAVGGLVEATKGYEGAHLVSPDDVAGLTDALRAVARDPRRRFADVHSWSATTAGYARLVQELQPR